MKKHESASDDFEGLLSTPGKALTLIGLSTPERLRRAGEYIYIYIYINYYSLGGIMLIKITFKGFPHNLQ